MNHMGKPQVAVIQEELSSEKNSLLNKYCQSGGNIYWRQTSQETYQYKLESGSEMDIKKQIRDRDAFSVLFSLFNTKFTHQFFITLLNFLTEPENCILSSQFKK